MCLPGYSRKGGGIEQEGSRAERQGSVLEGWWDRRGPEEEELATVHASAAS